MTSVHGLPDKYGIPDDVQNKRPPFEEKFVSATCPLELVHADVMGPFQEQSLAIAAREHSACVCA